MTRRVLWIPTPLTPPPPPGDLISFTLEFWTVILFSFPRANLLTLLSTLSCTLCNPCSIISQLIYFVKFLTQHAFQNLPYRKPVIHRGHCSLQPSGGGCSFSHTPGRTCLCSVEPHASALRSIILDTSVLLLVLQSFEYLKLSAFYHSFQPSFSLHQSFSYQSKLLCPDLD